MFRKLLCGGIEWIELAQIRDRWRALVNGRSGSINFGVFLA
jgi:hypothetical protein